LETKEVAELLVGAGVELVLSPATDFPMATPMTAIQSVGRNRRGMFSVKSGRLCLNKPKAIQPR
jgi:hypothetical protein